MQAIHMVFVSLAAAVIVGLGVIFYTKVLDKKINWLVLLIIISLLPLISILRNGTYESGDLTLHAKFTAQFFDNLIQGNLIPEWMGRHCGWYGCPVYIFIYPLPYYIGSFFHLVGFSFINSVKLLLMTTFVVSGVGMYLWIKEELNEKAGFVAGIFYLFAPYHLIDLHFRVAIGELLSFTLLPFTFLFTKKVVETKKVPFLLLLTFSFAFLILSHQVTSVVALPMLVGYSLLIWYRNKKINLTQLFWPATALFIGILLSAFYWLPVVLEGKLIWFVTDNKLDFHPLVSFLYSQNRFGLLFQGHMGELYMNVGYMHWLIVGLSIYFLIKKKVKGAPFHLLAATTTLFIILFVMMQEITRPIWAALPFLNSFQFTWRLLIEISLITAVMAAIVVNKFSKIVIIGICIITIMYTILNWGNRKMVPILTDRQIRTEALFGEGPGVVDLTTPNSVDRNQIWIGKYWTQPIEILSGKGTIKTLKHDMTHHQYIVDASSRLLIKENTYYYPGWKVFSNNNELPINYKNKIYTGVITFTIPEGLQEIRVEFTDTMPHLVGKIISFVSLVLLAVFSMFYYFWLNPKRRLIPMKTKNRK